MQMRLKALFSFCSVDIMKTRTVDIRGKTILDFCFRMCFRKNLQLRSTLPSSIFSKISSCFESQKMAPVTPAAVKETVLGREIREFVEFRFRQAPPRPVDALKWWNEHRKR